MKEKVASMTIAEVTANSFGSKKERARIVHSVMKVLKLEEVPTEKQLILALEKLEKRTGMCISRVSYISHEECEVAVKVSNTSYSVFHAKRRYEVFAKAILIIAAHMRMKV